MTPSLPLWLAAAALIAVAGFFGGRALHQETQTASAFTLEAPSYEPATTISGLSKGGFSGFGEAGGGEGRTVQSGRIVEVTPQGVVLEAESGARSALRLGAEARLQTLQPAARDALRPGVTVIVRTQPGSDEAEAVLVVSP